MEKFEVNKAKEPAKSPRIERLTITELTLKPIPDHESLPQPALDKKTRGEVKASMERTRAILDRIKAEVSREDSLSKKVIAGVKENKVKMVWSTA